MLTGLHNDNIQFLSGYISVLQDTEILQLTMQRDQAASRAERSQQRILDLLGPGAALDPTMCPVGSPKAKGTPVGSKGKAGSERCAYD